MKRPTPQELQESLDNNPNVTLFLSYLGKAAWYYVKAGHEEYQSVVDSAKSMICHNFKRVYVDWDEKRRKQELDKMFPQ